MKFHHIHGTAVSLSPSKDSAVRDDSTFCNGLVFSEQPIKTKQKISLELGTLSRWRGGLRIGVTSNNPSQLVNSELPRFSIPDLYKRTGWWVRAVSEALCCVGRCRLSLYLSDAGQLHLYLNGQHKGALLVDLPLTETLWLMVDVYGNVNHVTFVQPGQFIMFILLLQTVTYYYNILSDAK